MAVIIKTKESTPDGEMSTMTPAAAIIDQTMHGGNENLKNMIEGAIADFDPTGTDVTTVEEALVEALPQNFYMTATQVPDDEVDLAEIRSNRDTESNAG